MAEIIEVNFRTKKRIEKYTIIKMFALCALTV